MTPKTKRRLKWVVDGMHSGDYWAVESVGCGGWNGGHKTSFLCIGGTKRQAIAACEKHAREKGKK